MELEISTKILLSLPEGQLRLLTALNQNFVTYVGVLDWASWKTDFIYFCTVGLLAQSDQHQILNRCYCYCKCPKLHNPITWKCHKTEWYEHKNVREGAKALNNLAPHIYWGCTTRTGYLKCREVKTGFYRNKSMQTGSSGTLIGWKSGQITFVPLWDRMEGAWLRTLISARLRLSPIMS